VVQVPVGTHALGANQPNKQTENLMKKKRTKGIFSLFLQIALLSPEHKVPAETNNNDFY
jgi:hypothetical protein